MCRNLKEQLGIGKSDVPRRLVAVDVENVIGGAAHSIDEAGWAMRVVNAVIRLSPNDHVVLGASHFDAMTIGLAWESVHPRLLAPRSGANGADLAILEVLDAEHVEDRYDELVLVSGDGIFTGPVVRLTGLGLPVRVAAHRGRVARRLQAAATSFTYLTDFGLAA